MRASSRKYKTLGNICECSHKRAAVERQVFRLYRKSPGAQGVRVVKNHARVQYLPMSPRIHCPSMLAFLMFAVTSLYSAERTAYFPPPDSSSGWRTATNAGQVREFAGMDLPGLQQAWEFTQRCTQNGGLLVVRNGWLVFEKYFGRASRNANPDMASTGKAYASIACGIMLKEFHDKIPNGLETKVFTQKY